MTMLSLGEAARLIPGATVHGDAGVTFDRVSTDSRTAGPGDLFVALKASASMRTTSSAMSPCAGCRGAGRAPAGGRHDAGDRRW